MRSWSQRRGSTSSRHKSQRRARWRWWPQLGTGPEEGQSHYRTQEGTHCTAAAAQEETGGWDPEEDWTRHGVESQHQPAQKAGAFEGQHQEEGGLRLHQEACLRMRPSRDHHCSPLLCAQACTGNPTGKRNCALQRLELHLELDQGSGPWADE